MMILGFAGIGFMAYVANGANKLFGWPDYVDKH
jgi:hypothetical protein